MARREILDANGVVEAIRSLAHQIGEAPAGLEGLALVGIHTLGVPLAERIEAAIVRRHPGLEVLRGSIDITLYRDDLSTTLHRPHVQGSAVSFDVEGKRVVLVDDVCYTGRTARAAIDQIIDFGRPRLIELAVLVDRGHRELPIQPSYVGTVVDTQPDEIVQVKLREANGEDFVVVETKPAANP